VYSKRKKSFALITWNKSSTWFTRMTQYALVIMSIGFFTSGASSASAQTTSQLPYKILSVSPEEIVVSIDPIYSFANVTDASSGATLLHVTAAGTTFNAAVGSPAIPVLRLPLIAPSAIPAEMKISEEERTQRSDLELAPIPKNNFYKGTPAPLYQIDRAKYLTNAKAGAFVELATSFRGTYAQFVEVPLISYDPVSHSASLIKHAIVHIRFAPGLPSTPSHVSLAEAELFTGSFINGSVSEYYHSAVASITQAVATSSSNISYKGASQTADQWLQVETTDEGIYKISADDLRAAGLSTGFDTASLQLFGTGGGMLSETVDQQTGELRECPIRVNADGSGAFRDLYFYAPGVRSWKYTQNSEKLNGLSHSQNTYNSTGHYLLKVGGAAGGKRVMLLPDTVQAGQVLATVLTGTIHQDAKNFEHPNTSREFVGDRIPIDGSEVSYGIAAPGYTSSDWAFIRPGIDVDGTDQQSHDFSVPIKLNGSPLATISGSHPSESDPGNLPVERIWNQGYYVSASAGTPSSISLSMSSHEQDAHGWVAWIELIYHRNADLSNGTIPFMIIDTTGALTYKFDHAQQAQVWDVSLDNTIRQLAQDDGSGNVLVTAEGISGGLRKLIAFTPATISAAHLTKIDRPTLRATIGITGAEDIIIAPAAFMSEANDLKTLRTNGGEATEPLKTVVVSIDDIYREFGYGGHDVTAIRDFLSYTFRHTTASQGTVPMFVTLLGSGHADYQNRVTSLPNYVSGPVDVSADDCFFGRITNNAIPDVGVGRISAESEDEAAIVVDKLKHYEHGSAQGTWRSTASFASDDREVAWGFHDPLANDHIYDTENEVHEVQKRIVINKIYEVNYPTVVTSSGFKKPAAQAAVLDGFNGGSVLFSFVGHGNPTVWTHEDLLNSPGTINRLTNYDKLSFVTTATCDFSVYDDYNVHSGGVLLLTHPNGGAISLLGTSRPVYSGEQLVPVFFRTLLGPNCESRFGSSHIGTALMAGKVSVGPSDNNAISFYLQGDPALRLLVPRQYAVIDSLQSQSTTGHSLVSLPALSRVQLAGKISNGCDGSEFDPTFNGTATITLYDAAVLVTRVSTFSDASPDYDHFRINGPILYRGTATVKNGRFNASFIIPKDIEIDTNRVQFSIIAYSDDHRSALGVDTTLTLSPPDPKLIGTDTTGPTLAAYLGSRLFRAGDTVATHSLLIVDVHDTNGLNTSTASVGHSFQAWVDDSTSGSFDLASNYLSRQDDYTTGTSTQGVVLPVGLHVLHVRAFDAVDNPSMVDLPFVARDASSSFQIFQVGTFPNPMHDHTTFRFMQPAGEGAPVGVRISLFTTDGRRMRDIEVGTTTSSEIIATWDGRDGQGAILANGAYLYQIVTANINTGATTHYQGRIIVQR
jgi:hypothetical protein